MAALGPIPVETYLFGNLVCHVRHAGQSHAHRHSKVPHYGARMVGVLVLMLKMMGMGMRMLVGMRVAVVEMRVLLLQVLQLGGGRMRMWVGMVDSCCEGHGGIVEPKAAHVEAGTVAVHQHHCRGKVEGTRR